MVHNTVQNSSDNLHSLPPTSCRCDAPARSKPLGGIEMEMGAPAMTVCQNSKKEIYEKITCMLASSEPSLSSVISPILSDSLVLLLYTPTFSQPWGDHMN